MVSAYDLNWTVCGFQGTRELLYFTVLSDLGTQGPPHSGPCCFPASPHMPSPSHMASCIHTNHRQLPKYAVCLLPPCIGTVGLDLTHCLGHCSYPPLSIQDAQTTSFSSFRTQLCLTSSETLSLPLRQGICPPHYSWSSGHVLSCLAPGGSCVRTITPLICLLQYTQQPEDRSISFVLLEPQKL